MKRRTTWWVLTGLIVLAVAAISLRIYINSKRQWDDPYPPKDDDLLLEWPDIPDEDNAYSYLEELDDEIIPTTMPEYRRIRRMQRGEEEWDHEYLEKLAARNRKAFEIADKMIECDVFQPPKPDPMSFTFPPLNPIREVAHQWYQQSSSLLEQGKDKEAFDTAIKILRFGQLLEGTKGYITNYLTGYAIKAMGFGSLRQCAAKSRLKSEEIRVYIDMLADLGADEEGIIDAMRFEYAHACGMIDGIVAGKYSLRDFNSKYGLYPKHLKPGRLFQPNKTKSMLAETFRKLISNCQKSLVDVDMPANLEERKFGVLKVPIRDRIPFGDNKVGRIIHDWHALILYPVFQVKCRENSEAGITRLLLALKCYKLDHGDLPESLDELVPKYIDKIPIDDFDGKHLRYSKEKRIIYSVGRDMKDSGGRRKLDEDKSSPPEEEVWLHDDQVYKIEF